MRYNARWLPILLLVVPTLAIGIATWIWTSPAASAQLTATASLGVATATLELAIVAYMQIIESREAAKAQFRPVLVPKTGPAQIEGLWAAGSHTINIENVGFGVATDVWGVLLPPTVPSQKTTDTQFYLRAEVPIAPGECNKMWFLKGGTIFLANDRIGNFTFGVPSHLSPEEGMPDQTARRDRCVARMTLTYRDIFGRKYASIFDFTQTKTWVSVAIFGIAKDIPDLDKEKGQR